MQRRLRGPGVGSRSRALPSLALLALLCLLAACIRERPVPGEGAGGPPLALVCDSGVPASACARVQAALLAGPRPVVPAGDPTVAEVRLGRADLPGAAQLGTWIYAVAAPFFTLDDGIASADLQSTWHGQPAGPLASRPLLASPDTVRVISTLWGAPAAGAVRTVDGAALLAEAESSGGWAIVPFDELEPGWKVLRLDGISLLEKGLPASGGSRYPLQVPLGLTVNPGEQQAEVLQLVSQGPGTAGNRVEARMTVVAMTGTSCLTRTTAQLMHNRGLAYPASDIREWLASADLTHVSHEAAFTPDCPIPPIQNTLAFCSHDSYIALLEDIGTDIVELTGNHIADYGHDALRHTLELYEARGWQWFGGGANLAEARRPLLIEHGPNRLAFLGCNAPGPPAAWAGENTPGACPCDYDDLKAQVRELRAQGYLPIVTLQYWESYQYAPTPQQVVDFRALADAGAVVVQGSQAHQPQAMEVYGDSFVHYGLGNLFFDQMQTLGTRQELVDRLVFYDGRLLAVDLRTALLEEYGRPRPMTPQERQALLQAVFAARP